MGPKVVFFFPAFSSREATAQLGILQLATPLLQAGYRVRLIDSTITPDFQRTVLEPPWPRPKRVCRSPNLSAEPASISHVDGLRLFVVVPCPNRPSSPK